MLNQHTTEDPSGQEGILVPLDLPDLHILSQQWQANGTIRIEAMATSPQATCPHCQRKCVKVHDTRRRKKRDVALREHQVELILHKRRFTCLACHISFTEADSACGRRRRTTARLREAIGKQACSQPVEHVAKACKVGSRLVGECFESVATQTIESRGLSLDEQQPLSAPR